jgi:hypothetical protein
MPEKKTKPNKVAEGTVLWEISTKQNKTNKLPSFVDRFQIL